MDNKLAISFAALIILIVGGLISFNYYSAAKAKARIEQSHQVMLEAEQRKKKFELQHNDKVQPVTASVKPEAVATATAAPAAPVIAKMSKQEVDRICQSTFSNAESAMTRRQDDVLVTESMRMLESNNSSSLADKVARTINQQIIMDAYAYPLMSIEVDKTKVIQEFANKKYEACMRELG